MASQIVVPEDAAEKNQKTQTLKPPVARGKAAGAEAAQVLSYRHLDKRKNNPEVGMVTPSTDPDAGKTRWAYDPHLDPELNFDPQRDRIEQLIDDALASGVLGACARIAHHGPHRHDADFRGRIYVCSRHGRQSEGGLQ